MKRERLGLAAVIIVSAILFGLQAQVVSGAGGAIEPLAGDDLTAFRTPHDQWQFAGGVGLDSQEAARLVGQPGKGILMGRGGIPNIITEAEFADVQLHVEFMVPKGSNSGVYLMGRYEIQVLDSWGVEKPQSSDCGGIYERWDESRTGGAGYEGRAPRVNASKQPGEWQVYDITFQAPRFDASGKKTANAKFVKVVHNGQVIHENEELTGPTRAATYERDEKATGPLMLQGDHGPVAYRNIKITPTGAIGAVAGSIKEELYKSLMQYDFGKSRKDLVGIETEIRESTNLQKQVIEAKLVEVLESANASFAAKQFACRMLSRIGTEKSVGALSKLLYDEKLSHMARFALQQMPTPAAGKVLRDALVKTSGNIQIGIISSLGSRGDNEAAGELKKLAASGDKAVAGAAISALGWIGTSDAAKAISATKVGDDMKAAKADAYLMCADKLLKKGELSSAAAIYNTMTSADNDKIIRISAYSGLVRAEKEKAVPTILALLSDKDVELQRSVGALIREVPGVEATKAIAAKLGSLAPQSQVVVVSALEARGDKAAAGEVAKLTSSANESVRVAAIKALGAVGTVGQIPLLADLTVKPGAEGTAATNSLTRMTGQGVGEGLIKAAQSGKADVRAKLIGVLAARRQGEAVGSLLKAVENADAQVRSAACKALGVLATQENFGDMINLLLKTVNAQDKDQLEQALVSAASGLKEPKPAVRLLTSALGKADEATKGNLLVVLSKVGGDEALKAVKGELATAKGELRKSCIRAMSNWPDVSPAKELLGIAKTDSDETNKILALSGYIKLASMPSDGFNCQAAMMLSEAWKLASRVDEKRQIMSAVAKFPCPEALALAQQATDDSSVSQEAKQAVEKLNAIGNLITAGSKVDVSGDEETKKRKGSINNQIAPDGGNRTWFDWWSRKGSTEWVQYEFGCARQVSAVEVYWFDDTGSGECRVPESWKLLYKDGNEWKPVEGVSSYPVERDKYNRVTFTPVTTSGLKIELKLQQNVSGGIHEWKVE